jgi:hypothetical protein
MRFRVLGVRLGLCLALVVLAGCKLDVAVDVAMQVDGSGSVTVTAVADRELLAKAPGALADLRLDDVKAAGWAVTGPTLAAGGGQQLELRKPFTNPTEAAAIFSEISGGPSGPVSALSLEVARTFGRVRSDLRGEAVLDGGMSAFTDSALLAVLGNKAPLSDVFTGDPADGLMLTVSAHLPGRVTESNGTITNDKASVTWTPDLHGAVRSPLNATFTRVDQGALTARQNARIARLTAALYLGLVAAVVLVVAVWVQRQRRRRRRARYVEQGSPTS